MIRILLICLFSLLSSPGFLLARDVVFYHTDNVGTPVAMTNSTGAVVWRAHDKPFGEEYQTTATPHNSRRFIGKEKDKETGLVYIGARYLDPVTGRFLQPDPVGPVDPMTGKVNVEMLTNPQRLNRYAYGLNNPYRYIDPDGESPLLVLGLIGAAASYLSAPDVANAPADASTPTYKSNGGYSIAAGAAGGVGAGKVAQVVSAAKVAEEVGGTAHNAADGVRLHKSLASQSQMGESGKIIAGPGGRVPFRDVGRVTKQYGGNATNWVKKRSSSYSANDGTQFRTHWVENVKTNQRVEHKTKLIRD